MHRFQFLACFSVCALAAVSQARSSDDPLPEIVLRYLAYYDKIKSIECKTASMLIEEDQFEHFDRLSTQNGGSLFHSGTCRFDLSKSWERLEFAADSDMERIEIFRDGKLTRFNPSMNNGGIMQVKKTWAVTIPWGFGYAIGQPLGEKSGEGLPEILLKHKFKGRLDTGPESFIVNEVYRSEASSVLARIEVKLSKEFGYCPTEFKLVTQDKKDPAKVQERMTVRSGRFMKIGNIWVPTIVASKVPTPGKSYCAICEAWDIQLNKVEASAFDFRFPEDSRYYDEIEGVMHGPEPPKIYPSKDDTKTSHEDPMLAFEKPQQVNAPWQHHWSQMVWWILGAVLLIVMTWAMKKRLAILVLPMSVSVFALTGCSDRPADNLSKLAASEILETPVSAKPDARKKILQTDQQWPVVLEFSLNAAESNRQVRIPYTNVSGQKVQLEEAIRTSCGCTEATWTQTTLEPNESCELIMTIAKPDMKSKRHLQAFPSIFDAAGQKLDELQTVVELRLDSNWHLKNTVAQFESNAGEEAVATLIIQQMEGVPNISVQDRQDIEVVETRSVISEIGLYHVQLRIKEPCTVDQQLGMLVLQNENAIPPTTSVAGNVKLVFPFRWEHRILNLSTTSANQLELDEGWKVNRWELTPEVAEISVESELGRATFSFSKVQAGCGLAKLKVFMSKEGREIPCELSVFSFAKEEDSP